MIYCSGEIYSCWWNPSNHVYTPVTDAEKSERGLYPMDEITQGIARLCKLDLFSSEIAYTPDQKFMVIDYVNDQIDLRLQSQAVDGVPDALVEKIAFNLAALVERTHNRTSGL